MNDTIPAPPPGELGWLIEEGRRALLEYIDRAYPRGAHPFGADKLDVVRHVDFVKYADMCLEFVLAKSRTLYVVNASGAIVLVLCAHSMGKRRR